MARELHDSEERHRELFENANDVVYALDLDGNLTSLNRAGERLTGYTREELLGTPLTRIVDPREEAEQFSRPGLPPPTTVMRRPSHEVTLVGRDGRTVTLEVSSRLIVADGRPVGSQGIGRDITERLATERMQREFLAMASHELKNPLATIKGFAQIMQRRGGVQRAGVAGHRVAGRPHESAARRSARRCAAGSRRTWSLCTWAGPIWWHLCEAVSKRLDCKPTGMRSASRPMWRRSTAPGMLTGWGRWSRICFPTR